MSKILGSSQGIPFSWQIFNILCNVWSAREFFSLDTILSFGKELTLYQMAKFDWSKLKALADDKLNIAKRTISLFDRVENTVGKGENASYQHFLLFPHCFEKASFSGSLKVWIVW